MKVNVEDRLFSLRAVNSVFQEDISKLRRKIEKAKKPAEKISNGDDILNEEINDYKVCFCDTQCIEYFLFSPILLQDDQGDSYIHSVSWTQVHT